MTPRFPHWSGPTPDWPYPFPPIRGGQEGPSAREAGGLTGGEWFIFTDPVSGRARWWQTTESGPPVPGPFISAPPVTSVETHFLTAPDGSTHAVQVSPDGSITAAPIFSAPPPPTVQVPGPGTFDPASGTSAPTTTTVQVTGQGFEVRDPATGAVTVYPVGTDGLPILSNGVQIIGPQAQAGAAPVRVTSQVVGNNLITIDPFSGQILSVQALPPETLSPFQSAQLSEDSRRTREQTRSNLANEFFEAQRIGLSIEQFQQDVQNQAQILRQGDENLQLLRDRLAEETRANRSGEALATRSQIEVEQNNQRQHQVNLRNLELRGQELFAQVDIARSQISGQNADRLLQASEAALSRTTQVLGLGLQDEQFRLSQKAQLLDAISQAAQSPFDVVRQAVLATQGPIGISQALARGEDALTPEGLQALGGELSLFQQLSRPSDVLTGPLAQRAVSQSPVSLAPLPGLPQPLAPLPVIPSGGVGSVPTPTPAGSMIGGRFFPGVTSTTNINGVVRDQDGNIIGFDPPGGGLGDLLFGQTGPVPLAPGETQGPGTPPEGNPSLLPPPPPVPALAGGGATNSSVAVVGEQGPELIFDLPGGGFAVLNAAQAQAAGLGGVLRGAPRAQTGGIFGDLTNAALLAGGPEDLLASVRRSLLQRFLAQGLPITATTGPVGVSAPGTPRNLLELVAGFQASAGFNPQDTIDESLRATPPGLNGRARLTRTR